jgi:outer membrane protein OmpA-like peptidoglycan-associated protein
MKSESHGYRLIVAVVLLVLAGGISAYAQDGKLTIHVTPKQTYVFVDDRAFGEASHHHSISLSAGNHKIELVNYGYTPANRTVTITAGETANLEVTLEPVAETVTGPFGAMTIEGASRDAVLLNGKTPDFFVGHGDEFNHDWWWKQELVVPPGTYQVTILSRGTGTEAWAGQVEVPANQRVVLDVPKGVRKTVSWPRGEKLSSVPRFKAGTASATVAVAKPTAQLSTTAAQLNCGDATQLKWQSADAPHVEITPVGTVAASGEQSVQPKENTVYQLTALGPGGTATASTTVNVNTAIQADLGLTPSEVRYKKVGDQVVDESGAALNWTASNASAVSIDPIGAVSTSGNQTLPGTPKKTDAGPVDETVTYTLTATNTCGGTETKTAALHIVGSIEPAETPGLALNSIYFPTDMPTPGHPKAGLVSSQQATLQAVADAFKKYLANKPDAHLILVGHADERGPKTYNQALSERRSNIAKNFLVEQGIPADNIEVRALGDDENLDADQVKQQMEQNPNLTPEDREKATAKLPTIVLANNRRVDITLDKAGQEPVRQYPFQAQDFPSLVNRNGPQEEGSVELAAEKEKSTP